MNLLCHKVTCGILLLLAASAFPAFATPAPQNEADQEVNEHPIQPAHLQLSQIAMELRDAEAVVAEKTAEYEIALNLHQREQSEFSLNSLDQAQQRLALAEMAVEAKAARLQRAQRKLSELMNKQQEMLNELAGPPSSPLAPIAQRE